MKYVTSVGEQVFEIEIDEQDTILVNGEPHAIDLQNIIPDRLCSLLLDHVSYEAFVENTPTSHSWAQLRAPNSYQVLLKGYLYHVQVEDERAVRLAQGVAGFTPNSGEIPICAPMPGLIVSVPVQAGQPVEQGEVLVILESMKMDNELGAPRDGKVARVHVQKGDNVESKQRLVTLV